MNKQILLGLLLVPSAAHSMQDNWGFVCRRETNEYIQYTQGGAESLYYRRVEYNKKACNYSYQESHPTGGGSGEGSIEALPLYKKLEAEYERQQISPAKADKK